MCSCHILTNNIKDERERERKREGGREVEGVHTSGQECVVCSCFR